MAGGEYVGFNNSVFLAEREVSDRNCALAYYMKENKCFPKGSNIKDCLDFWYQVCFNHRIGHLYIILLHKIDSIGWWNTNKYNIDSIHSVALWKLIVKD